MVKKRIRRRGRRGRNKRGGGRGGGRTGFSVFFCESRGFSFIFFFDSGGIIFKIIKITLIT